MLSQWVFEEDELSRAESVMWEHPDSALLCLSSLDSSIMNEPENIRMYHALLKIKAKDKLYIPHESDSLIKSIVQYYVFKILAYKHLQFFLW